MNKKNFFSNLAQTIERFLPMTFSSFVLFLFTLYLFFIVGRTIYINYNSNKDILVEEKNVENLAMEVKEIQNRINYYQTSSFKEKEAREKLGYRAPGENVMSLPIDQEEDKKVDGNLGEVKIKTPNYRYWWEYYFE